MKVLNGRNTFQDIIERGLNKEELKEELVALLKDNTKFVYFKLINRIGWKMYEVAGIFPIQKLLKEVRYIWKSCHQFLWSLVKLDMAPGKFDINES